MIPPEPDPEPAVKVYSFLSSATSPLSGRAAYDTLVVDGVNYTLTLQYRNGGTTHNSPGVFIISGSGATESSVGVGVRVSSSVYASYYNEGNDGSSGTSLVADSWKIIRSTDSQEVSEESLGLDLGSRTKIAITW